MQNMILFTDFIILIKKIILAIAQGLTEILPVSSSGHLLILSQLLNIDTDGLTLVIFLHFGSLIAMIIYYHKTLKEMIVGLFKYLFKKDRNQSSIYYSKLFLCLIISSIPGAIVGVLLGDIIDNYFTNLYYIFIFLSINSVLLLFSKKLLGSKKINELNFKDASIIGLFQCIGIFPGISRSGITILGAKRVKLNDEDAASYSFLMFLPITLGSFIWELIGFKDNMVNLSSSSIISDLIAVIISGVTTYIAIYFLLKLIKKGKLYYFSYYCLLIALLGSVFCLITNY